MSLRIAVICGMAAAIVVPAVVVASGWSDGGLLYERVIRLPVGGGMELHWSWPVFCIVTLGVWLLLAAVRDT
jgi:hypothetical protein